MIIKNPSFTIKPEHVLAISKAAGSSPDVGQPVVAANVIVELTGEFDVAQFVIDEVKEQLADYRSTVETLLATLNSKKQEAQAIIDANAKP